MPFGTLGPALRRALLVAAGAALVGAVFVGCPRGAGEHRLQTTPITSGDPRAQADLEQAERAAEQGRVADAERLYRAFLAEHPADPLAPLAALGLGRVLLARGEAREALDHLNRASASEDEVVAERAHLHRGVALHLLGRSAEAVEVLRPLRGRLVDPADATLLLRTLAAAALRAGDAIAALDALDALASTGGPDADEARARIEEIAQGSLDAASLARAYDALDRTRLAWPRVAMRALRTSYETGEFARVRQVAADLQAQGIALPDDLAALVLRAERMSSADPRVIGAILPLSGRGREIGQRALRGLMLAAGTPPEGPPPPDAPQLVFRDDGGDPDRAARAVEELVSTHRVIAIVGPLDGPSAQAAARRAQQLGVPLVALSTAEEVTSAGPMAFRLFPTPEGEVRALVRAARARGAQRFAALHPDNAYGEAMRATLARVAAEEGGELAVSASYPPGATSFGPLVARLAASRPDAVLLPDSGRQVALMAPALAAAGLWSAGPASTPPSGARRIVLLVPSPGFDPGLARSTGRYLQGALFSTPFHAPTAVGPGRAFADLFLARFAAEPDVFSAYAYDAFLLVRRAVVEGAASRDALARWLAQGHEAPTAGASGGLTAGREPRRATRLLELRGEIFAPLD